MFLIALLFMSTSKVLANEDHGVIFPSKCPKVEAVENFDIAAYGKGVWYQAMRYANGIDTGKKCIKQNYTLKYDTIVSNSIGIPKGCASYKVTTSKLAPDADGRGIINTKVIIGSTKTVYVPRRYFLDVDNENYAIIYRCKYNKKKNSHQINVWIASRDKELQGEAKEAVNKYIDSTDIINREYLIQNDNSDEACMAKRKCCENN